MTISEKNRNLKKNQYIHLVTLAAGLALGHASDVNSNNEGYTPMASFFSAENCAYPIDFEIENALAGPGGNGSNSRG